MYSYDDYQHLCDQAAQNGYVSINDDISIVTKTYLAQQKNSVGYSNTQYWLHSKKHSIYPIRNVDELNQLFVWE